MDRLAMIRPMVKLGYIIHNKNLWLFLNACTKLLKRAFKTRNQSTAPSSVPGLKVGGASRDSCSHWPLLGAGK